MDDRFLSPAFPYGSGFRRVRTGKWAVPDRLGYLEFCLEYLIWTMIGGDPRRLRRLTARLDVRPKCESIADLLPEPQRDAWPALRKEIKALAGERNWIAHGAWLRWPGDNRHFVFQTRKGDAESEMKFRILTREHIDTLSIRLDTATSDVKGLIGALPPPKGLQPHLRHSNQDHGKPASDNQPA